MAAIQPLAARSIGGALTAQLAVPRSSAGVWIAGALLALAAAGGVAFFAVNRPSASDVHGATSAQTSLTSATAPISTVTPTTAPSPVPAPVIDSRIPPGTRR